MQKLRTRQMDRELRQLIAALKHYRLQQNFTYRELAERIDLGLARTFEVLNYDNPQITDRTRFRLQQFADRVGLLRDKASA